MTETGVERFEAAWREACANHENMADAIGRLLDEQGARLARVEALVADWPCENFTGDWVCSDDPSRSPESVYIATGYCWPCRVRAALAPEAEGA